MNDSRRSHSPKPAQEDSVESSEVIHVTGNRTLTPDARRVVMILWRNAHRQGVAPRKDYTIHLSELCPKGHTELVEEAIVSLMQMVVTVKPPGGGTGRVQLLGGNDMDDPRHPAGLLTYSFDSRLVEILRDPAIWSDIAIQV